jgi:hypothetical protein
MLQELSPTTDANLVKSLMNLVECQIDDMKDESKMTKIDERQLISQLEVCKQAYCTPLQSVMSNRGHAVNIS